MLKTTQNPICRDPKTVGMTHPNSAGVPDAGKTTLLREAAFRNGRILIPKRMLAIMWPGFMHPMHQPTSGSLDFLNHGICNWDYDTFAHCILLWNPEARFSELVVIVPQSEEMTLGHLGFRLTSGPFSRAVPGPSESEPLSKNTWKMASEIPKPTWAANQNRKPQKIWHKRKHAQTPENNT